MEGQEGLPVKLWGLDPIYLAHVKLFIKDVLELTQYPGFKGVFAISNHPIAKAQITGYVVQVQRRQKLTIYGVDDGTATMPCCHWIDQDKIKENHEQPDLGDLVTVLGRITTFRGERQITLTSISFEKDPNAEVLHWLEVLKNKEIYKKQFVPPKQLKKPEVKKVFKKTRTWFKNDLDREIYNLEHEIKDYIGEFIDSKNVQSFSINNLCAVSDVKEKAIQLSNKYKEGSGKKDGISKEPPESVNVVKIMRPILSLLEKDGKLYRKECFSGYYEVISEKGLGLQILNVMQMISDKEGESSYGISSNKIMSSLLSMGRYKCVSRDKIQQVLESLVKSGDICQTKNNHYRKVCK